MSLKKLLKNRTYEIQINREAAKYLKKLDKITRIRIKLASEGLMQNPSLSDTMPLKELAWILSTDDWFRPDNIYRDS